MIVAELVDGCHLKCKLCWNANRKGTFKNMSLETIKLVADKYNNVEKEICWHNWGEPLLHKRLEEASNIIKGTNSKISSSFSMPISDERLESLNNFSEVVISLSGMSPSVYNIYHIGGDFDLVMKNIQRLAKIKKTSTGVQWLIHKYNEHQLESCMNFCAMYGLKIVSKGLNLNVEEQIAGAEDELQKDYDTERDVCYLFKDTVMDVDGNYLVCCATRNIKIGLNIRDNVCHEEISEARDKTEICQKCQKEEYWRMY